MGNRLLRPHHRLQMAGNRKKGTRRDGQKPRRRGGCGRSRVVCGGERDRPRPTIGQLHDERGNATRRGVSDDGEGTAEKRMGTVSDGHVTRYLIYH